MVVKMKVLRDLFIVFKNNIMLAIEFIKIYRFNLFLMTLISVLFFLQYLFTVYVFYIGGIYERLGVTLREALLTLLTLESALFLKSLIYYRPIISTEIETGTFKNNLLLPLNPIIQDNFSINHFYILGDFLVLFLPFPFILIFLFKIKIENFLLGFLMYFIYLIFLASLYVFYRSLDLLIRNLTHVYIETIDKNFENLNIRYTPAYLREHKFFLFLSFFLVESVVVFYLVVPAFLYGKINYSYLTITLIVIVFFIIATKLIWDKRLKHIEIYN